MSDRTFEDYGHPVISNKEVRYIKQKHFEAEGVYRVRLEGWNVTLSEYLDQNRQSYHSADVVSDILWRVQRTEYDEAEGVVGKLKKFGNQLWKSISHRMSTDI